MSDVPQKSLLVRLAWFTVWMLVLGGLCTVVANQLAGMPGVEAAGWATLFCIVPGWLVFLTESLYRLPRNAVYLALLGSMVRLMIVTAGCLLVVHERPELPRTILIACLVVMYSGGLWLETWQQWHRLPLRKATRSGIAANPAAVD